MSTRWISISVTLAISIISILCADKGAYYPKANELSHKERQPRPIPLGVSGGNVKNHVDGRCCSGTLGALVRDSSAKSYILSNAHVLAGHNFPGDSRQFASGDAISQPGGSDLGCRNLADHYVAKLARWGALVPGGVTIADAAIAEIIPGQVDPDGRILGIGTVSSVPKAAYINQRVKKSGRTTGVTYGTVYALNATISVGYNKTCGGGNFSTTFKNQILIIPGDFIRGGDSGALVVEDIPEAPSPIGLIFAGSPYVAVAHPIQTVLTALDVSLVGVAPERRLTQPGPFFLSIDEAFWSFRRYEVAAITALKEFYSPQLMSIPGAVGHAVGLSQSDEGTPFLLLLVEKKSSKTLFRELPIELQSIPMKVVEVGKIEAY